MAATECILHDHIGVSFGAI